MSKLELKNNQPSNENLKVKCIGIFLIKNILI